MSINQFYFGLSWLLIAGLLPSFSIAQSGFIAGKVIDQATRRPLVNATVMLEGTTMGTVTTTEGKFHLNQVSAGSYQLVVTYVGYTAWQQAIVLTTEQSSNHSDRTYRIIRSVGKRGSNGNQD